MHSNNTVWGMGIIRDIGVIARDVSVDFGRFWRSLKETEGILKNEMFWKAMLLIQSKKVLIIFHLIINILNSLILGLMKDICTYR